MEFIKTTLQGCTLIKNIPQGDERGYFTRTFCANEFKEHGLNTTLAQASYSFSKRSGTVRGLHFQAAPIMEDKLVRCLRGAIFDVMVDIRLNSPTFGQYYSHELSETNNYQLHSVQGFAHGFQTLTDDCVVAYHIAQFYDSNKTSGIRWDDPEIGIVWPQNAVDHSSRDLNLPFLSNIDSNLLINFNRHEL